MQPSPSYDYTVKAFTLDEYFDEDKGYCTKDCSEMDPMDRRMFCPEDYPDEYPINVDLIDISYDDMYAVEIISSDYSSK